MHDKVYPTQLASPLGCCCGCCLLCRYNITRKHMEQLVESIQSLGYQFVLIDCPAGIDVGFINAISPAKEALIVTTPEITSIRCAEGSSLGLCQA